DSTEAVANLADVAAKENCLLIHISTDYVFDGTGEVPYTEKDKTCPMSVYGRTKLDGERLVRKSGCCYIIIRTSWLYSAYGHNFVKTILRLADERQEISVVSDQFGSPTYAGDLAKAIVAVMDNENRADYEGIYHFSNEGACSWYDFAKEIVRIGKKECKIIPVSTAEYPTKTRRPAYSVLDNTKIKRTFDMEIPEWKEALKRMMEENGKAGNLNL
ncbi:MAG: dTDP-4-dehydrorhamnose reductase, partial [Odoribacter sp.]|nr:dTDP-4-dehydrorhamnose reductase [Odoribacter sp.]